MRHPFLFTIVFWTALSISTAKIDYDLPMIKEQPDFNTSWANRVGQADWTVSNLMIEHYRARRSNRLYVSRPTEGVPLPKVCTDADGAVRITAECYEWAVRSDRKD
jgi:hypothetical protein